MSQAKNLIEGLVSLVEHINATHFKVAITQASLIGEFTEDELRLIHDKVDRCRHRLMVVQNMVGKAVEVITTTQMDMLNGSTVPESSSAVPRDHRSNGSAD